MFMMVVKFLFFWDQKALMFNINKWLTVSGYGACTYMYIIVSIFLETTVLDKIKWNSKPPPHLAQIKDEATQKP